MTKPAPIFLLILLAATCAQGEEAPGWEEVQELFEDRCTLCHEPGDTSGGLNLRGYGAVMEGGGSGAVIVPGDPDGSRLFRLVTRQEQPFMPEGEGPLTAAQIETLRAWIAAGAPDPDGVVAEAPAAPAAVGALHTGSRPLSRVLPRALPLDPLTLGLRPASITALAGAPGAPLLAVGSVGQLLLYHATTGELLGVLPFPAGRIHHARFSRDGSLVVAVGGEDATAGRVTVWDLASGGVQLDLATLGDALLTGDLRSDGRQIAVGDPSRVVRVFDTRSGEEDYSLEGHTDWITAVAFSPDGVLLATADRAGGLRLWESLTGRPYLELPAHGAAITALDWRGDSNVLASACEDGNLRLFEVADGKPLKTWKAHGGGALDVAFAPDGRLASAGRDRRAKLWAPGGSKLVRDFGPASDLALGVAFADGGEQLASGDWTGHVRSWRSAEPKGAPSAAWPALPEPPARLLAAALQALSSARAKLAEITTVLGEATRAQAATATAATRAEAARDAARAAAAATPETLTLGDGLAASLAKTVTAGKAQLAAAERAGDPAALEKAKARLAELQRIEIQAQADAEAARDAYAPKHAALQRAAADAEAKASAARKAATVAALKLKSATPRAAAATTTLKRAEAEHARWTAEQGLRDRYRARDAALGLLREAEAKRAQGEASLRSAEEALLTATRAEKAAEERRQRLAKRASLAATMNTTLEALIADLRAGLATATRVQAAAKEHLKLADPADLRRAQAAVAEAAARVKLLQGLLDDTTAGLTGGRRDAEAGAKERESCAAEVQKARSALAAARAVVQEQAKALEPVRAAEGRARQSSNDVAQALEAARVEVSTLRQAASP